MVPQEVRMGMNQISLPIFIAHSHLFSQCHSFDNSGQRLSFPQWQTNQTNVNRMNSIVWQLAYEFQHQSQVVSVIAPLNE
jgi:hypothetical protein